MFNLSKIIFFFMMMIGSLITISSNSWLNAWMGLEINLLTFIPLMSDNNLMSTEASMKYFLIQTMSSIILIFSGILIIMKNSMQYFFINNFMNMMIFSSLLMKMGVSPFHFWFPAVMEGLSWTNSLILMTWQKIAPMILISYINLYTYLIIPVILSAIFGSLGGLNQTSLRKLMSYSSINHMGWMLSTFMFNEFMWILYFIFYSFLSSILIFTMNVFKIIHINQLFNSMFNSTIIKFLIFLNLLSLGGLPPFLGFYPKWMVIQLLTTNNQFITVFILVMTTLITLFFYMRLCYSTFMLTYLELNWMTNMYKNNFFMKLISIFSSVSIFGFFLISYIYLIF